MPGPDYLLQLWIFHVLKEVLITTNDTFDLPRAVCDTARKRSVVPESKLAKLELLLNSAPQDGGISFPKPGKLAGKCNSMSVAVPPASLYMHHMYKQIAQFQRTGVLHFSPKYKVTANSGLRSEMELWLDVRAHMNGASWYDAAHHALSIPGATDASSTGWGGASYEDPQDW